MCKRTTYENFKRKQISQQSCDTGMLNLSSTVCRQTSTENFTWPASPDMVVDFQSFVCGDCPMRNSLEG